MDPPLGGPPDYRIFHIRVKAYDFAFSSRRWQVRPSLQVVSRWPIAIRALQAQGLTPENDEGPPLLNSQLCYPSSCWLSLGFWNSAG